MLIVVTIVYKTKVTRFVAKAAQNQESRWIQRLGFNKSKIIVPFRSSMTSRWVHRNLTQKLLCSLVHDPLFCERSLVFSNRFEALVIFMTVAACLGNITHCDKVKIKLFDLK